jgi:hypothetical protein
MSGTLHSVDTGAHNVIDYLIIFALLVLLIVLSMPTIMQLATLLREDPAQGYQSHNKFQLTAVE